MVHEKRPASDGVVHDKHPASAGVVHNKCSVTAGNLTRGLAWSMTNVLPLLGWSMINVMPLLGWSTTNVLYAAMRLTRGLGVHDKCPATAGVVHNRSLATAGDSTGTAALVTQWLACLPTGPVTMYSLRVRICSH